MKLASAEVRLAIWALVLNFAWEMLQAPLFVGMLEMPWPERLCYACARPWGMPQ